MCYPSLRIVCHLSPDRTGSLVGLLTSATYATPKNGRTRVLALFFSDLPFPVWAELSQSFRQQELERKLLKDDAFFAHLKQRLALSASATAR